MFSGETSSLSPSLCESLDALVEFSVLHRRVYEGAFFLDLLCAHFSHWFPFKGEKEMRPYEQERRRYFLLTPLNTFALSNHYTIPGQCQC